MGEILALYDVRGIQDYIFRTPKIKEAVGASKIIENIYMDALENAVCNYNNRTDKNSVIYDFEWCTNDGVKEYKPSIEDIQVVYIGGGNACVIFSSETLASDITRLMSKYVIEATYSLQLAAAFVNKTDDYARDYEKLRQRMAEVKDSMAVSRPIGTLPVMKMELKTGYPLEYRVGKKILPDDKSKETAIKYEKGWEIRKKNEKSAQILDSFIIKKEFDSTLAVIHIDGNSMSTRIASLLRGITDYSEAVNRMREISYRINQSFKNTYKEMETYFNLTAGKLKAFEHKEEKDHFVAGILVAGDDITYICNGQIAFSTVEYFVKRINAMGMYGSDDTEDLLKYGFTVCAGVAFINSHFPFSIGYEVAEACCSSAKKEAKKEEHIENNRIGNWIDFQICKNIQAQNLKRIREREYITPQGEVLCIRPYVIPTEQDPDGLIMRKLYKDKPYKSFTSFCEKMKYLQDPKKVPKSLVKQLRNTYPLGSLQTEQLLSFMKSRNWKLPEDSKLYYETAKDNVKIAALYDALELMDDYTDVLGVKGDEKDEMSD